MPNGTLWIDKQTVVTGTLIAKWAILDINQITGYYAFVNRLADGLGVELEPYWDEDT